MCIKHIIKILNYFKKKAKNILPFVYEPKAKRKPEIIFSPPEDKLAPKNYIHLSLLKNYLDRYNLNSFEEKSFFELESNILNDGRKVVLEKLRKVINSSDFQNNIEGARKILEIYAHLKQEELTMNLPRGHKNKNTPKIYKSAVRKYLEEFQLEEIAENNFETVIFTLIDKLYNYGKNQMLEKFAPNIEWLEKYVQQRSLRKIKDEIGRIQQKIEEIEIGE